MLGLNLALSLWTSIKSWLPSAWFTNNEQGVWYDPSDFSTMFQDSAGTTPVTAVEQPVGLMLDKSKGLVLGPELVTNGTFDSASNWTVINGWSISGGAYNFNAAVPGAVGVNTGAIVIGKTYEVTFSVTNVVFVGGGISINLGSGSAGPIIGTAGTFKAILTAAGSTQIYFKPRGAGDWQGTIDNISVRELPGNHATQATSTKRPVLSARVNLLTKTEDFGDAAWAKTGILAPTGGHVAPDGTSTAWRIVEDTSTGPHTFIQATILAAGNLGTANWWIKPIGDPTQRKFGIGQNNSLGNIYTATTSDWVEYSSTFVTGGGAGCYAGFTDPSSATTYTGDGISGFYVWHPRFTRLDQASLPYQRVNTATDYDTVGFKHYLKFDGVDDALSTGSIDFTATDKMTVVAGVRKLSDAALGAVVELSSTSSSTAGTFVIFSPLDPANTNIAYRSGGSVPSAAVVSKPGIAAPYTGVVTAKSDIAGDSAILRINGVQASASSADQGTGNYGNYPLYIGSRAGTSFPFNGHLYSLIIRGAQSTDAQIVSAETYVNSKTGAYE